MTSTIPAATLLLAILLLGACRPATDAPAADAAPAVTGAAEAAPTAGAAPGTDARLVSDETSPVADPGFDARTFAGTFQGALPCADCPGIDSRLELHPDGRYSHTDRYRERDTTLDATGTWTVEDRGSRLRLDPDDKGSEDRLFDIVSSDELRMLGADGRRLDTALDFSLRRSDGR
jgi:copper homeostasis protein (lipoprotein)